MSGDRSPYAILGLRPGAGRAEINDAYRKLMKRHHPDRPGGDSNRAAEINRAYTYLRRRLGEPVRVPVTVPVRNPGGRRTVSRRAAFLVVVAAAAGISAAVFSQRGRPDLGRDALAMVPQSRMGASVENEDVVDAPPMSLDQPVQSQIVAQAIADAVSFHSRGDLSGARAYSDACQTSLRRERTLGWFDSCAAFDEAMLTLHDARSGDPGPFNESEVITREVAAAQIFTDDSLSADAHLHDIRSQVDMAILPMLDSAAAEKP